MTVLDASVFVDAIVRGESGTAARAVLRDQAVLSVPAVFPAEVTSAVRALALRGDISLGRARFAVSSVASVRAELHPFAPFLPRVWELRENLTVYDAWYVALAETLDATLWTADPRLARAPGPRCHIRHVGWES